MIIDASGGSGTVFQPHFMSMEKGEPERHELLKTKCTFAKVALILIFLFLIFMLFIQIHGVGTIIVTSFPDLETQGANLNLECIYNAIQVAMTRRGMNKLRNLYIQLDNANVNKNWTLFAGLSALVLTGN